ncbi:Anticodon-binding [Pseudocohnilembus persalinus]|uniref:glycine--tRNA ligase n=1 Tax=Pseudocohnilembus persalinus TaxID=266149 RepID=A0A0V0R9L9_PSEPJ|nr:Anticodon-binding [Pseudocohnilembus persalinus]|eukprot:KRX11088.1 Anticodon-binding [Pseudocohnilembus persalinus]
MSTVKKVVINKQTLQAQKEDFEKLMNSRSFYFIGSEIYGGIGGLYDWGPPGCAIRTNVQQFWREHFILEDDMLEISTTSMTPEIVFQHSGHIKKFSDLVVRDSVNRRPERADKYLIAWCTEQLEKNEKLSEEQKLRLTYLQQNAEEMEGFELHAAFQELQIKSIDGNLFTEPEPFNLMFQSDIGPSGGHKGYLRPETAQGMFVNFNRLKNFANDKIPFAAAQIGLGFRNEIAPKQQLLRVREFDMAEIEHFYDPQNHTHPKFKLYADMELPLLSAKRQRDELADKAVQVKLGEAVTSGLICNETMAYFLARTYLFLTQVGINPDNIRFRQHKEKEMAHYANDCWDAEIELSAGWVEAVGHASRQAYDLACHAKGSGQKMLASRKLEQPKKVKIVELILDNGKLGLEFQRKIQLNVYYNSLSQEERTALKEELVQLKSKEVQIVQKIEKKNKEGVIEVKEKTSKQNIDLDVIAEIEAQGQHFENMQAKVKAYIEDLSDEENRELLKQLDQNQVQRIQFDNFYFDFHKSYIKKIKETEKVMQEEKFQPHVIEPAFGLGRVITGILEHSFRVREETQQEPQQKQEEENGKKAKKGKSEAKQVKPVRAYLNLPPRIAPIKCSILPLMAKDVFQPTIQFLKKELNKVGISNKVDESGVSIGKRYARTDELGIPFGITVDYETLEEGPLKDTFCLREISTTKQVRIPKTELIQVLSNLSNSVITWEEVVAKYPAQIVKEDE